MKKLIKLIGLIFLFLLFQQITAQNNPVIDIFPKEWKLYQEYDGIMIYYKTFEQNDKENGIFQELVIFKMINTTNVSLEITWKIDKWYNNVYWHGDDDPGKIILNSGDVIEYETNKKLYIFSRFLNYDDKPELTKFKFCDVIVKPVYQK